MNFGIEFSMSSNKVISILIQKFPLNLQIALSMPSLSQC